MTGVATNTLQDRRAAIEKAIKLQGSATINRSEARLMTWAEYIAGHTSLDLQAPPCRVDAERLVWVVAMAGSIPVSPSPTFAGHAPVPWKVTVLDVRRGDRVCEEMRVLADSSWPPFFDQLPDYAAP
jgi:hypothetical protein